MIKWGLSEGRTKEATSVCVFEGFTDKSCYYILCVFTQISRENCYKTWRSVVYVLILGAGYMILSKAQKSVNLHVLGFLLHWDGLFTCAGVIHLRSVYCANCPVCCSDVGAVEDLLPTMIVVGFLLFGCGERLFSAARPGRQPCSHHPLTHCLFQQRSASPFLLRKICPFTLWTSITPWVGMLEPAHLWGQATWSMTSTGNNLCRHICPIKVRFWQAEIYSSNFSCLLACRGVTVPLKVLLLVSVLSVSQENLLSLKTIVTFEALYIHLNHPF